MGHASNSATSSQTAALDLIAPGAHLVDQTPFGLVQLGVWRRSIEMHLVLGTRLHDLGLHAQARGGDWV